MKESTKWILFLVITSVMFGILLALICVNVYVFEDEVSKISIAGLLMSLLVMIVSIVEIKKLTN